MKPVSHISFQSCYKQSIFFKPYTKKIFKCLVNISKSITPFLSHIFDFYDTLVIISFDHSLKD